MSAAPRRPEAEATPGTRRTAPSDLKDLDVAVVTTRDDQGAFLIHELQQARVRARHIWPMPESVPSDADVVYCDYVRDLPRRLPWIPGDARAALVVIVPPSEPVDPVALAQSTPDAILARPFTSNAVIASLVVARSQFRYQQRLRAKIERLDDNLRSIRTVERAKAILMATRHLAEDDAYGFIRRQAMDRRVSASAVAAAIVDSYELLGFDQT